jgi:hypothetical protein
MRTLKISGLIVLAILVALSVSSCATPGDGLKSLVGVSTREIEDSRKAALTKVFDYDYRTCYEKTEKLLEAMPEVSIYARDNEMIAVYWKNVNTTPVGIFFKAVDTSRTQIEVSSPSTIAKEWVSKNIFEEKILQPLKTQKYF